MPDTAVKMRSQTNANSIIYADLLLCQVWLLNREGNARTPDLGNNICATCHKGFINLLNSKSSLTAVFPKSRAIVCASYRYIGVTG